VSAGGIFAFTDVASAPQIQQVDDAARSVMNSDSDGCSPNSFDLMSASISDGKTWIKASTDSSTDTVTRIYSSGEVIGSKTKTIEGTTVIIVDGEGEKAGFYPAGCADIEKSVPVG
jgi:hypothetical protein